MNAMNEQHDSWDEAVSRRLSRLSSLPVDVSRLEKRLEHAMGGAAAGGGHLQRLHHWWGAVSGVAAAVVLAMVVGLLVSDGGSPAVAGALELSQLHQKLVAGELQAMQVGSIDEANAALADQNAAAPQLPRSAFGQVKSCCISGVEGRIVACVLLAYEGKLVTLTVADGRDLCSAMGANLQRGDHSFMAHKVDGVQMVMANEGDRWLCVMGDLPADRLADLAVKIKF
jgi:hypothetical protein